MYSSDDEKLIINAMCTKTKCHVSVFSVAPNTIIKAITKS